MRGLTLSRYLGLLLLTLGLLNDITSVYSFPEDEPPMISEQPDAQLTYLPDIPLVLHCKASGSPKPLYRWTKNGEFYPDAIDRDNGTLVIPYFRGTADFQCSAFNKLGTALSVIASAKPAMLESFPTHTNDTVIRPKIGESLKLTCNPPVSYPDALIYWGEARDDFKLSPIDNTARVSLDYEGNMHFAHVLPEDYMRGRNYLCAVQNKFLNKIVQGNAQKVTPEGDASQIPHSSAKLVWSSTRSVTVLTGQRLTIKCIFSGYPTPTVSWAYNTDIKIPEDSFGQELVFDPVITLHESKYTCTGKTSEQDPGESAEFSVTVESVPLWEQKPVSQTVTPGSRVEFICRATGHPTPVIQWSVNGQDITDYKKEREERSRSGLVSNITVTDSQIEIENTTLQDNLVVQCNASNKHGYVFTNAFLSVRLVNVTEPSNSVLQASVLSGVLVILLLCIIAIIVTVIVCATYRNKAVIYKVEEKERRLGVTGLMNEGDYEEVKDTTFRLSIHTAVLSQFFPVNQEVSVRESTNNYDALNFPDSNNLHHLSTGYSYINPAPQAQCRINPAYHLSRGSSAEVTDQQPTNTDEATGQTTGQTEGQATGLTSGQTAGQTEGQATGQMSGQTETNEQDAAHLYAAVIKKADRKNQAAFNPLSNL